jgi:hypothetical protein
VRLLERFALFDLFKVCGGYFGGVTPVPIPNTEVKPTRADGTAREAARESRSLPHFLKARLGNQAGFRLFWGLVLRIIAEQFFREQPAHWKLMGRKSASC